MNRHIALAIVFCMGGTLMGINEARSQSAAASFEVASPAVRGGPETGYDSHLVAAGRLDAKYAAKPTDAPVLRSFPFSWSGLPTGTKALAIILDDPDAKPILRMYGNPGDAYIHWLAADIDPASGGLGDDDASRLKAAMGRNSAGKIGYIGPQPPADTPKNISGRHIHVYRLYVYALSATTGLKAGFSLGDLKKAVQGKTLAIGQLRFSYSND
jgi:hypothetical protein